MSVASMETTLMGRITRYVGTGAASDRSLVSPRRYGRGWDAMISQLLQWSDDPAEAGDDDGFDPPSYTAIGQALELARAWRDAEMVPPLRVLPDGEGGIAFERREGPSFKSLRVSADGTVELLAFENSRLISHDQL